MKSFAPAEFKEITLHLNRYELKAQKDVQDFKETVKIEKEMSLNDPLELYNCLIESFPKGSRNLELIISILQQLVLTARTLEEDSK